MVKKIWERIRQLVPPPLRNKFILTGALFLLWITLLDPVNVVDWMRELNKRYHLKDEKQLLERNIENTTRRINAFSNIDSLEKIAREQFYFVAPDEEIFIIEGD